MEKAQFALWEILFIISASIAMGFVLGGCTMENRERCRMMDRAVAEGHARFYLDEKNVRCWEWLPACRR